MILLKRHKRYFFILLIGIFCASGYAKRPKNSNPVIQYHTSQNVLSINSKQPRLIIHVHGTDFSCFAPSGLKELLLAHVVSSELSYISTHEPGLIPINQLTKKSYTQIIGQTLSQANSHIFPIEHLYQFGWPGDNLVSVRRSSSQTLYHALKKLVKKYTQIYGITPHITLISHSHGGNVILHMIELFETDIDNPIHIDLIVLLACPVQKITRDLLIAQQEAKKPMFLNIISVHSKDDPIQIADPQCLQPFTSKHPKGFREAFNDTKKIPLFSKRTFNLPSVIDVQAHWLHGAPWHELIEIIEDQYLHFFKFEPTIVTGFTFGNKQRGLAHMEFILPFFLEHIPALLDSVETYKDMNPITIHIQNKIALKIEPLS